MCSGLTARDHLRRPAAILAAHGVWHDGGAHGSSSVLNDESVNGDHIARRALSAEHDRRDRGDGPARFHVMVGSVGRDTAASAPRRSCDQASTETRTDQTGGEGVFAEKPQKRAEPSTGIVRLTGVSLGQPVGTMRMLTTLVLAGASVAAEAEPMTSHMVRSQPGRAMEQDAVVDCPYA